ncbi:hypothetical protein [Bogoriella caseilytica]|uniref:hypothetical protein n=1 Tax=Bogoriella caseilytica TaxID=56055 RepID=UPI000F4750D4|nr:hypothetical protein [Bogoriella caseilytica]
MATDLAYLPVPAEGDAVTIQATDLDHVAEVTGHPKPDPEDGADAFLDWAVAVGPSQGGPVTTALGPDSLGWSANAAFADEVHEALGVSLLSVDRFTEVLSPPNSAAVLHGPYDTELIDSALGGRTEDVWQLGDPDGGLDPEAARLIAPSGSGTLMEVDDRLLIAPRPEPVTSLRDNQATTFDEDAPAVATAEALDAEPWYSATLIPDPYGPPDPAMLLEMDIEEFEAALGYEGLLPFAWLGVGLDLDGEAHLVRAVYTHLDEDSAHANAELLEAIVTGGRTLQGQPYSDHFELRTLEVEGEQVLMTLEQLDGAPGVARSMLQQREGLFFYR